MYRTVDRVSPQLRVCAKAFAVQFIILLLFKRGVLFLFFVSGQKQCSRASTLYPTMLLGDS